MTDRIGFIGVGFLGKTMAVKVAQAGFDLTVYDNRPEALGDLLDLGAKAAKSPADLARDCDIIELMVATADQVEDVTLSSTGILTTARPKTIIVIHSTVGPDVCRKVAEACKQRGIEVLDAGVSGGVPGAEKKTLALMVGGEAAVLDRCRPVFKSFASNVYHLGELGNGQIGKILNNHALLCNQLALNEALHVAKKAGLPLEVMVDVINGSTGRSWASENWHFMRKRHEHKFATGLHEKGEMFHKDLSLALSIAHKHGVPAPVAALTAQFVYGDLGFRDIADA